MSTETDNLSNLSSDLKSIKRALWTVTICIVLISTVAISLMVYGGLKMAKEFNKITSALDPSIISLENIVSKLKSGEKEFTIDYATGKGLVTLKFKFEPFNGGTKKIETYEIPACKEFEKTVNVWNKMTRKPIIRNIFIFYGTHGSGKSYCSKRFGDVFSNFGPTVVVSSFISDFANVASLAAVNKIVSLIEETLESKNVTVIWNFDELDTYLITNKNYDSKNITKFAEDANFMNENNDTRRILMFTMNNAIMFKHNYWDPKEMAVQTVKDDAQKAVDILKLGDINILTREGQLSRLYSFMGTNKYEFKNLDKAAAKHFAHNEIKKNHKGVPETQADTKIDEQTSEISIRDLMSIISNSVNEYYKK